MAAATKAGMKPPMQSCSARSPARCAMSSMCMKSENHGRRESTHRQTGRCRSPRLASRREKPKQREPSSSVRVSVKDSDCSDREVVSSTSGKQNCFTAEVRAAASPVPPVKL